MKKLLALTLTAASMGFAATAAEAKTAAGAAVSPAINMAASAAEPQRRTRRGWDRRDYNRRPRTVTQTRMVRYGRQVYRETYRVTYLPNGRTQTRLISRVRVR